jgi:uncharacterized protein with HEPN domain
VKRRIPCMSPVDRIAVEVMRGACWLIVDFVKGMTLRDFLADQRSHSAVAYQFVIIGEATKHLSRSFRDNHDAVPWREMAGMRNILVHDYLKLDISILWRTATHNVPALAATVTLMLDPA